MASFAFNFQIDQDDAGSSGDIKSTLAPVVKTKQSERIADLQPPPPLVELSLDCDELPVCEDNVVDSVEILASPSGTTTISYYCPEEVSLWARANDLMPSADVAAELTDLVSGIYEGGFQLWECSVDLAEWLLTSSADYLPSGLRVIELGCGGGLPGLACLWRLAPERLAFQDFNAEVLRAWTMPNTRLNLSELNKQQQRQQQQLKLDFLAGTWASLAAADNMKGAFDLVLTAETIYNPDYYDQLHGALSHILAADGEALVAAKVSYFGVGGSESLFCEFVDKLGEFQCETVLRVESAALTRVILRLRRRRISHA